MSEDGDEYADTAAAKPNAQQVLHRALILSCVAARGFVEAKQQLREREQTRSELLAWFNARGLQTDAEPGELALLQAPVGTLDGQQAVDAGWRCEGVLVLAWSLGLAEIGPFYEQISDPRAVVGLVGYMDDERADQLAKTATLRPERDIERYARSIRNVHWRLRDLSFRRRDTHYDCRGLFAEELDCPIPGSVPPALSGDLDLLLPDGPVHGVSPAAIAAASSVVRERHQAANWLIGDKGLYSEVSLDT